MATLTLSEGGRLDFDDAGNGTPIVFLHGWSLGKEAFAIQRRELQDGYRIVVPDMRGHGHTARFGKEDGIDTLAGDLGGLLVRLDLTGVVLVGWSLGALVAWELANGPHRGRIAGIVTIDMVPKVLNGKGWRHGLRAGAHLYDVDVDLGRMRADWRAFTGAYIPKIVAAGKAEERRELIESMTQLVSDNDVDSMMNLWTTLVRADYIDLVQRLDVPTLITHGRLSQIYTEEAAVWMDEHIPNSRRVGFAESGHAPHLEEAQLFNQTLAGFADELETHRNERRNA